MQLIDTHAHLASDRFRGEVPDLIARARDAGVTRIITIGTELEDSAENLELARQHPEVFAAVGVHPTSIHEVPETEWLDDLRALAARPRVAAIGEIGLDYYHPPRDDSDETSWRRRQAEYFEAQLDLAAEIGFPVVIHQRESADDTFEMLKGYSGKVKAVCHCFTGSREEAFRLLDLGFHLSFTGVVTFKNAAEVAELATEVPLDRLMVETDAPYLAPVPYRGKRCEPAYTRDTAAFIAEKRGMNLEEFASATTKTAEGFFRL